MQSNFADTLGAITTVPKHQRFVLCNYVDVAYYCRSSSVVSQSVTVVSPAKMAEPVELSFVMWTQVGVRNHILAEVQTAP